MPQQIQTEWISYAVPHSIYTKEHRRLMQFTILQASLATTWGKNDSNCFILYHISKRLKQNNPPRQTAVSNTVVSLAKIHILSFIYKILLICHHQRLPTGSAIREDPSILSFKLTWMSNCRVKNGCKVADSLAPCWCRAERICPPKIL